MSFTGQQYFKINTAVFSPKHRGVCAETSRCLFQCEGSCRERHYENENAKKRKNGKYEKEITLKVWQLQKKVVPLRPLIENVPLLAQVTSLTKNKKLIMYNYETVFILTPVLSDEQMKETVAKFKKVLTDNGAEMMNEEAWGLKKMAYPIDKKSTGFYNLFEFKAEPTIVNTLEVAFRRDEKVIRFLTVKLDKYAVEYAEKRRKKYSSKAEEA